MKENKNILNKISNFFSSKKGIVFTGAFIGVVAAFLQYKGNPGNMGFCVACFERDIAGALNLHSKLAYIRPEILGFILGSFIAALIFKEFKARTGSAPIIRFVLGFFAMIGALVFLGCPWRAFLRLAGGDANAILGISGLAFGVYIGSIFIKNGYSLGRNKKTYPLVGLIIPAIALILLVFLILDPVKNGVHIIRESPTIPHAALSLSLIIGLAVGFFAQRSRFCTIAGIRDTILIKDMHLFWGILALVIAAFITNIIITEVTAESIDQFNMGFKGQPAAHDEHLWNFMGMVLAGLGFVLAGGCPGRQLILSGEGNADSGIFVIGMVAGAAFSHNFLSASSGAGTGDWGPEAVIFGLIICLTIGFFMREKS